MKAIPGIRRCLGRFRQMAILRSLIRIRGTIWIVPPSLSWKLPGPMKSQETGSSLQTLYPKCALEVIDYLSARDLDGDLLPEGRTQEFPGPIGPDGSACSSVTYIGDTLANAWKDFGRFLILL